MTITRAGEVPGGVSRFGCFVLQARAAAEPGLFRMVLVLEDVGTGEKHRFSTPAELGQFIEAWGRTASRSEPE